ncbi:hypothetical protein [Lactiplantibacillus modestisalitolerans]|uniref:Integral membrane protein n=1 Tax=Lactiplantibacillus modestisalitolerans TaxID=1457219 RepID=A0ABV5WW10_9LACO|nr:hypothetical protein [Lactiplantibacillus modestisalitolerans]
MEAVLLIISILLIVFWGVVDRQSIRALRTFTKIGIVTYLIALICFTAAKLITATTINIDLVYAGAIFSAITVLAIINIIANSVATLNISRAARSFFDAAAMAVLFGALISLIQIMPTVTATRSYILLADFVLIAAAVLVAVISLLVIVMKILFGSDKSTSEQTHSDNLSE